MDLTISQLMQCQRDQYEAHKDIWHPRDPERGRHHILYMIEEVGETIAILKKKGEAQIMEDPAVRAAFVEELVDVSMYFTDVLLCFDITPEEFSQAFLKKFQKNMGRNYTAEYKELYHGQK